MSLVAVLVAGLAGINDGCGQPDDNAAKEFKDAKQELDKLQGEWTCVSSEVGGKKRPDTENALSKLTISENQWVVTYRDSPSTTRATIEIDPSKDPKTIDLTFRGEKEPARGIYKLEGTPSPCATGPSAASGRRNSRPPRRRASSSC
jgi:uncharacterized protein (TIGR03067 family)